MSGALCNELGAGARFPRRRAGMPRLSDRPASSASASSMAGPGQPRHVLDALADQATLVELQAGEEIAGQGETNEYCIQVISGCVRTVRLLEDGRRLIGAFLLPGDVFGWETAGEHLFAAEAVTPVKLRRFRLAALEEAAARDNHFGQALRRHISAQLGSARQHMVLLGRLNAAERIAAFLTEMRLRLQPGPDVSMTLPMCRVDIADYLCLTVETVSRGLSRLRRHGAIKVKSARIVIHSLPPVECVWAERIH